MIDFECRGNAGLASTVSLSISFDSALGASCAAIGDGALIVRDAVLYEGAPPDELKERAVNLSRRLNQRAFKIDEENDARLVRIIDDFMLKCIIKDNALSCSPRYPFVADADAAALICPRDDQAEVISERSEEHTSELQSRPHL